MSIPALALAQDATPTAESLLNKAIELEKAQAAKGWTFTYREDEDKLPVDKNGKALTPSHRTYENIMLEGDLYRKLILVDGKPPDPKLQKAIDGEIEKERAARRAHPMGPTGRHEVRAGALDQISRMCDSKVTGQEPVSGRMAWRVESLPKPGYKPKDKDEEKFLGARRVTWFDQEGPAIRFLEVFLRPTAGFLPGSEIERTLGKHGDAWLIDTLDLRYDMRLYGVVRGRGVTRCRFYDYKKFEVESKVVVE